jgi:hypothetical protein
MPIDPLTGEEFLRVVGRRQPAPVGELPSAETRQALASLVQYRTRAPKGVFIYRCHADMDADRMKWTVEAIVAQARAESGADE